MKKHRMKIKYIAVLLAVFMLATVPASTFAAGNDVPTLFHNDEEWYKDGLYPMTLRDGKYYIPAELFAMFDYISVTTPLADNILIHNTENGQYVSILFMERSAAVNGSIVRDVGVFRDDDMYYVDAEMVCDGIGMEYERYTSEDGQESLRLYDRDCTMLFEQMIRAYLPEEDKLGSVTDDDQSNLTKRIFLICKPAGLYDNDYSAQIYLDIYGLDYTLFLNNADDTEAVLRASARGEYGVLPKTTRRIDGIDIAAELDGMNSKISVYTGIKTRLTLATGNDEEDGILREQGYIPIKPDFTVNGSSDAESLFTEIILRASRYGFCTVYLEDCWNSYKIAELISEIIDPNYITSNLNNANR